MNKNLKSVFIMGFALFSTFFGAGNLIFPPTLGIQAGNNWMWTMLGFLITCISLPLIGIIAVAKSGGNTSDLTNKVNKSFGKILCSIIMLCIGPFFCIPRTAATTFELGVQPLFPKSSLIIVSIIYFSITLIFVINETNVINKIGAILTPFLLITLLIIILKGIISPLGTPINTGINNPFSKGFIEGYQTMDALGSIILAQMIVFDLISKGYKNKEEQIKITIKAGIVSAICLGIIYGGLVYIGSTVSGVFPSNISRTDLLINITQGLLGNNSKIIFGSAISVACLTTSIGLTATAGNYFSKLTKGKLSYKFIVTSICIFSCAISNYGVETIIKLAVPVLIMAYPIVIVLILMSLFDKFIKNKSAYSGAVYATLIISVFESLNSIGINISIINDLLHKLPFADKGFSWILPAILGGILGGLFSNKKSSKIICEEV